MSAKDELYALLRKFSSTCDYDLFRIEWERLFNFELARDDVSTLEFDVFEAVFDTVVWYSPFASEREIIPNYKSEGDVDEIIKWARAVLPEEVPHEESGEVDNF